MFPACCDLHFTAGAVTAALCYPPLAPYFRMAAPAGWRAMAAPFSQRRQRVWQVGAQWPHRLPPSRPLAAALGMEAPVAPAASGKTAQRGGGAAAAQTPAGLPSDREDCFLPMQPGVCHPHPRWLPLWAVRLAATVRGVWYAGLVVCRQPGVDGDGVIATLPTWVARQSRGLTACREALGAHPATCAYIPTAGCVSKQHGIDHAGVRQAPSA